MAKKPARRSYARRAAAWAWGYVKRNPGKVIVGAVTLLGGVPSAFAGAAYLHTVSEPLYFAQHYWVRDWTQEQLAPVLKVQADQNFAVNYLILKDLRGALKDAKDELVKHPDSVTAPREIERLESAVKRQEDKVSKTPIVK